ncbi:MAG: trypsin-like peptidase domain-containing protein [Oscillospiraceae bacterium]|nr:trypsin-like peptidase domain-containing protein [Oscillospiraceae bacterium]
MRNKSVALILALCLALALAVPALGAASFSNFERIRVYDNSFADVPSSAWFHDGVRDAYEHGIMIGRAEGVFEPHGRLTIAETFRIASTIHRLFHTGSDAFSGGTTWYAPYVDYARRNGIPVRAFRNFNAYITRSDFAVIMAGALPDEALTPINRISDGGIPDVMERFSYGQSVYMLYRAGVLIGSDAEGTFFPGRTMTRAEAATIVARMIDAELRIPMTLDVPLTAEQVYEKVSPAVFFIEVLDAEAEVIKTGSGFFISESGMALTNQHVVVGAHALRVTLYDGEVLYSSGLFDVNRRNDTALIQIPGNGFPYLEISDTAPRTGATVFALGSPLGLQASFSRGIVSQALREVDGMTFIQLDAAISTGSSGGALIDAYGRAVGVTTATMIGAQNINLAVPIELFMELSAESYDSFDSLIVDVAFFEDFFPAPDFGAHFGVRPWNTGPGQGGRSFSYRVEDLPRPVEDVIEEYIDLVEQNLFERMGDMIVSGNLLMRFYNPWHDVILSFGPDVIDGVEVITVNVS